MRTRSPFALAALLLLALPFASKAADAPPGFTAIFNGKDLAGWTAWAIHEKGAGPHETVGAPLLARAAAWLDDAKKHWTVENGELVNDGHGAYLATAKEYGDYELHIEYKTVAKADSGIYLKNSPQVQIWDSGEADPTGLGKKFGSGGLWNNTKYKEGKDPLVLADKPLGEWNKFRIIQVGARTTVYLNDKLVVEKALMENFFEKDKPLPKKGSILLQTHGGEIRWRNIFVKELNAAEANAYLAAKYTDGYKSLFDGKSLDGWAGAVENYEVIDGAIVCKPKKGGVLRTAEEYADFEAIVEFKLPKNGNNGLAIRYPGTGDPAYSGMCELQVLDDAYAGIDPRQAHGSAYGMAAAKRGFHRPVGEWNFQHVAVKGPTIRVELNGNLILETDLSKIKDYMANSPHPGKELTKGFFGFAGHNDPVAFRNVAIKSLAK